MAFAAHKLAAAPRPVLRPVGQPSGVWIDRQLAGQHAIALCSACKHKFDFKRHNYVPATRWGYVTGRCDDCRSHTNDQIMFIHESGVCNHNGRIRSGHVYTPR